MNRRFFVGMLGAGCVTRGLRAVSGPAITTDNAARGGATESVQVSGAIGARRIDRVGIQLYTLRAEMERDVEGTLVRVGEIGYREVEFAGYFGRTPAQLRAALRGAGLDAPSAHVEAKTVEGEWGRTLDEAAAVGHDFIVAAWIDAERRRTLDDWKGWAERFGRAAEQAKAAGLRFAYHNHDYEFAAVGGRVPYDVLLENTDADLVAFEMDLFWLIRAGGDPLDYFARQPHRFPLVHVKDMDAQRRMVDVGRGTIDFHGIFEHAARAGIRHYFVEHDEPVSPFDSARTSFEAMRRLVVPAAS